MTEGPLRRTEMVAVLAGCAAASLSAALWSWQHHAMLNYGDAVAHLHIARRVIDSHRPGLSQLGSVWLPLPHLLMVPFVAVYAWWADGIAGLIPSALAYVAGCAGLYRLARLWLSPRSAAIALAFFALNPNLLYMQTTAMTEPLFVCEMIWVSLWMVEWRRSLDAPSSERNARRLGRLLFCIAFALIAAIFTRYDGWIMALLGWTAIGLALARRGLLRSTAFWVASALVVAAPIVWFTYNGVVFGDWLDFMRGPYSARAIELRTATPGSGPPHPGWHNMWVSLKFFVKAAEMDAAPLAWGNLILIAGTLGTAWGWLAYRRSFAWTLLLWLPIPFYAYSVAYGSVPIFLPPWWPHSWYNTRYGMELLPALALGFALLADLLLLGLREVRPRWVSALASFTFALIALGSIQMMRERPLVYVEGTKNLASRESIETAIPPVLRAVVACRPGGAVLMNTSVFPQLVAMSGIPLRQTLNESDREFYSAALESPASHAAIVVAFTGDDIDRAVQAHPNGLTPVARFVFKDQPSATIYVSGTSPSTTSLSH